MKKFSLFALLLCLQPAGAQERKESSADKVAKRLTELLAPGGKGFELGVSAPLPKSPLRHLDNLESPLPLFMGTPPRLEIASPKPVQPRNPSEGTPLANLRSQPEKPADLTFPVGWLVRLPSVNVQEPVPLPILAQPQKDRASLADPTLEASVAAALAPVKIQRTEPVPFIPINLPDPFENAETVRLRVVPEENPQPALVTPRAPGK